MFLNSQKALLKSDGTRLDDRLPSHVRPAFLKTGAVSVAAGSAYAEFGSTKVIVSVYGPRESKKAQAFSDIGRLNCDVKFTSFATPLRGKAGQDVSDKEFSVLLHKALEDAVDLHSFPKTTVDVFALVLQSGGGDLPAIITCASLALADAGIVMHDIVAAISLSCVGKDLLLDPTYKEESQQDGSVFIALMTSRREITQVTFTGEWSSTKASEALELCCDACVKLGEVMRICLKEDAAEATEDT
ncbi:exosome complex component MTR3 [Marchantia polymorpha subsp. ruderalis]